MSKPAIPAIPVGDPPLFDVLSAMKEEIETVRGIRVPPLVPLNDDASLGDVIDKINEIIARVNV